MTETAPFRLPSRTRRAGLAATLALLAGLSGCGGVSDKFPPACPRTSILADAAELSRYRSDTGGRDLTDLVLSGRVLAVAGQCQRSEEELLDVVVSARLDLTRGPASTSREEVVPVFVAVSEGNRILDKKIYRIAVKFPANTDRLRMDTDEIHVVLPITRQRSGAAYDLVVGFQLTPDELATNRRRQAR